MKIKISGISILYLITGGILGTILHFCLNNIFLSNIIGCIILGILEALELSNQQRIFWKYGFSASITSFSSFILIHQSMIQDQFYLYILLKLLFFILISLFAMHFGFVLATVSRQRN